jgi:hypothetical protein
VSDQDGERTEEERRRPGWLNFGRRKITQEEPPKGEKRVIIDPDIFMVAVSMGLVLLGTLVGIVLWQQSRISDNQDQIKSSQRILRHQQAQLTFLERRDRVNSYQAAYRFCTRESIDRAAVHWFLSREVIVSLPAKVLAQARRQSGSDLRRMERKDGMPILDCNPNTVGNPAKYLPPAKQREFVERWRKHQLTPAEIGICKVRIGTLERPGTCLK